MEVIQNIKNVSKNVKLIKDKNLSKQYEEVQKVDDFTNNIQDLIKPSLDLIEQKVGPKLTFFNNTQQQQPKAIQASSDLHGSSSNPLNNGETILNEPAAFSIVEETPDEREIESSPIDLDEDIESTPNRLAVVIGDRLDREILKKRSLPSFDFLRRRYDNLFTDNQSKARDFKVICDDLTSKMKSISGKMEKI